MSEIMMQLHFMYRMPGIILQRPLLCRDKGLLLYLEKCNSGKVMSGIMLQRPLLSLE
jgi:hypothetical protein